MDKRFFLLPAILALFLLPGCTEQSKIDKVRNTVIPGCGGRTMHDLASGLLEGPVWALQKGPGDKKAITVQGTLVGDKLPSWVKEQRLMEITFTFPVDPKTEAFDPAFLDGFPSLTTPEGIFQTYKALICQ